MPTPTLPLPRWAATIVIALLLAGCDAAAPAPRGSEASTSAVASTRGDVVPGRYIVVLDEASARPGARVSAHAQGALDRLAAAPGVQRRHTYTHALVGFSAEMTGAALAALRRDPAVRSVEPVTIATGADALTQTGATWAVDRVDQRALPLSGSYTYDRTGAGVTVYVVDSGLRTTHEEFARPDGTSRASLARNADGTAVDFVGDGQDGADCNGHGTHVAASAGGATYGVAKGATLVSVRVLNCANTATTEVILAGMEWVAANATERPAVANMSLSAGNSTAIETAARNMVAAGITLVAAAANDNTDACRRTPARVPEAITVGATTTTDARAAFSNWGTCLDLFAPGDGVLSASWEDDAATRVRNGTSMATAHASGAAALYLEGSPAATPAQVASALTGAATAGVVTSAGRGSPNRLLYTSPPQPPAPPTAAFAVSCSGLTCTFTDRSTGGPTSWAWSFGDGGTSALQSPTHAYAAAATYTVRLTATNAYGSTSATQSVRARR